MVNVPTDYKLVNKHFGDKPISIKLLLSHCNCQKITVANRCYYLPKFLVVTVMFYVVITFLVVTRLCCNLNLETRLCRVSLFETAREGWNFFQKMVLFIKSKR